MAATKEKSPKSQNREPVELPAPKALPENEVFSTDKTDRRGFLKAALAATALSALPNKEAEASHSTGKQYGVGQRFIVSEDKVVVSLPKSSVHRQDKVYSGDGRAKLKKGDIIELKEPGHVAGHPGLHEDMKGQYTVSDTFGHVQNFKVFVHSHGYEGHNKDRLIIRGVIGNHPAAQERQENPQNRGFMAEWNPRRGVYEFSLSFQVPRDKTPRPYSVPHMIYSGRSTTVIRTKTIYKEPFGPNSVRVDRHGTISPTDENPVIYFGGRHRVFSPENAERYILTKEGLRPEDMTQSKTRVDFDEGSDAVRPHNTDSKSDYSTR